MTNQVNTFPFDCTKVGPACIESHVGLSLCSFWPLIPPPSFPPSWREFNPPGTLSLEPVWAPGTSSAHPLGPLGRQATGLAAVLEVHVVGQGPTSGPSHSPIAPLGVHDVIWTQSARPMLNQHWTCQKLTLNSTFSVLTEQYLLAVFREHGA